MDSEWVHHLQQWLFYWDYRDDFLTAASKDQIQTLQKEVLFLKKFFCCRQNWACAAKHESPSATKAIEAMDSLAGIGKDTVRGFRRSYETGFKELLLQVSDKFMKKLHYYKPVLKEILLDWLDLSPESKCSSKRDLKNLVDEAINNLKDLLVLKPDMIAPVKKQIGAVEKRLECVSAIFHFASREQHVDQLNSYFNHLQDWANTTAAVPFLYWVDETDERVNAAVSSLIQKFNPCTLELPELYLVALKAFKPSEGPDFFLREIAIVSFLEILLEDLVLPTDDDFEMLQDGLLFFISFFVNPPREYAEIGKLISTKSSLCVNKATSLICSLFASNLKEDIAKGSSTLLHDLLENMNQAQAEIRELHHEIPAPSSNIFPKVNIQGFLEIFFRDLNEKGNYDAALTTYRRNELMRLQKELLVLKPLIMGVFYLQDDDEELKDLQMRISRMAYCADYAMDSCFLLDPTNYWRHVMCLSYVIEEFQFIKIELNKSRITKKSAGVQLPAQAKNATTDNVMVGFADEMEKIINCLIGGLPQLDIVAIVGMAGQGKTTLANKLYHDRLVRLHFQKYAWCCISQAYQIKDILISILKDVNPTLEKDDISNKSHEDLAEMLYRCLKGKPYLIVLDDIWNIEAWKELKASFPDDENGSRIMFTSRIHKVALEAKPDYSLHELHPLSPEDSFQLLQQKLSYKDGFPPNLLDIGKKIAEDCKGLPLAIIVIAGLLAKADGNLAFWKQIAENLKLQVVREGCMDILEVSYKHLPDYLKPCFLYLAAFEEDERILAKKLTRYWIAEGFIRKHDGNKRLEDVANEYLEDLVDRCLLLVAKRSSRFGIKKCVVHDLVREFCLEKAKQENFLLVPNISDDHTLDTMHMSYRLCFQTQCWSSFQLEPTAPIVRTLLFSKSAASFRNPFFIFWFKVLRVLDLLCIHIESDIDAITQLVHLRYLALSGTFLVPSSIVNLSRLEFLILMARFYPLPKVIWNMRSLRHLYLFERNFQFVDDLNDESLQLDNLEVFSSFLYDSGAEELKWLLRRIPNVQKLSIRLEVCVRLSDFLSKLKSLYLLADLELSAIEFELPPTLGKLKIDGATLSESMISAIGKLPNLEVLKLIYTKFVDQRWNVEDDEFLNLKYLKLHYPDIEEWNVSTDAFPQLQQLILKDCDYLVEVPPRFGLISTMKVMKFSSGPELIASVREIVAEQLDLGDVGLQITTDFFDEE